MPKQNNASSAASAKEAAQRGPDPARPRRGKTPAAIARAGEAAAALSAEDEAAQLAARDGEDSAKLAASAEGTAMLLLYQFGHKVGGQRPSTPALIDRVKERVNGYLAGDTSEVQRMLLSQALTLQSIFAAMASKAASATDSKEAALLLQVALKAQGNCRTTLEALDEITHPRAPTFIRQANVSQGHQQVNNGVSAAPALPGEVALAGELGGQGATNKLLEVSNGERLDGRAQGAPAAAHSDLEALVPVNRAEVSERQADRVAEPPQARPAIARYRGAAQPAAAPGSCSRAPGNAATRAPRIVAGGRAVAASRTRGD